MADGTIRILTELVTDGLKSGLKLASSMIAGSAAALGALGTAALKVGTKFESSMSQVAATMGITKDTVENGIKPFDLLSKAAKDAGASTKFSASEAAEGLNYLALAGYSAEQSAEALPAVLNLAAAGGLELAYASDLATDAMAALGIEASNKNLTEFGDKMAKTASKANTSVGQLGEAILTVGGTAKGLAGGTTELNAALGVLANRGIKGSEGGTALRNVILALSAPTDKAASALEALGIEVNDAEGKMRPLNEIFTDLNASLADMSDSQKTKVLSEIFHKVDLKSAQALLAGCGDEFKDLTKAINTSDGAMAQMADTMNDNLKGQVTILKSSLEGLGIEVYESVQTPLKNLAKQGTKYVGQLTNAFKQKGLSGAAEEIGRVFADIAAKISKAAPKVVSAATQLVRGLLRGIKDNAKAITESAVAAALDFADGVLSVLPDIVDTGMVLISGLISGIGDALPELIPKAIDAIIDCIISVISNADKLLEAGGKLISGLLEGVYNALPVLLDGFKNILRSITGTISDAETNMTASLDNVRSACDSLEDSLADMNKGIVEGGAEIDAACTVAGPWVDRLAELEQKSSLTAEEQAEWNSLLGKLKTAIPEISDLINDQTGEIDGGTSALKDYILQWKNYAKAKIYAEKAEDGVRALVQAEEDLANAEADYASAQNEYNTAIAASKDLIAELTSKYPELSTYQGENVKSLYDLRMAISESGLAMGENADEIIGYEQKVIALCNTIDGLGGDYMNLSLTTEELGGVMGEHRAAVDELRQTYEDAEATVNEYYEKSQECTAAATDIANSFTMSTGQIVASNDEYIAALQSMASTTQSTALKSALSLKSMGKNADISTREAATNMLSNFEGLPDEMQQSGKNILLGLIGGMEDEIPGLEDTSEMSAEDIVSALKDYLGIHSPSKVTKDIGSNIMAGLKNGISGNVSDVVSAMKSAGKQAISGMQTGMQGQLTGLLNTAHSIADKVTNAFKARLDIHSPSRRIAKEVGKPTAQGIGVGFRKALPDVFHDINRSIDRELTRIPTGSLSVQHQIQPAFTGTGNGPFYNIVNNVESPIPITVEEGVKAANRASEDSLFKLGVDIA